MLLQPAMRMSFFHSAKQMTNTEVINIKVHINPQSSALLQILQSKFLSASGFLVFYSPYTTASFSLPAVWLKMSLSQMVSGSANV